jgi:hypothetical protein
MRDRRAKIRMWRGVNAGGQIGASMSRTGFSREEAAVTTLDFAVYQLTLSRLKPVPHGYAIYLWDRL